MITLNPRFLLTRMHRRLMNMRQSASLLKITHSDFARESELKLKIP